MGCCHPMRKVVPMPLSLNARLLTTAFGLASWCWAAVAHAAPISGQVMQAPAVSTAVQVPAPAHLPPAPDDLHAGPTGGVVRTAPGALPSVQSPKVPAAVPSTVPATAPARVSAVAAHAEAPVTKRPVSRETPLQRRRAAAASAKTPAVAERHAGVARGAGKHPAKALTVRRAAHAKASQGAVAGATQAAATRARVAKTAAPSVRHRTAGQASPVTAARTQAHLKQPRPTRATPMPVRAKALASAKAHRQPHAQRAPVGHAKLARAAAPIPAASRSGRRADAARTAKPAATSTLAARSKAKAGAGAGAAPRRHRDQA